MRLLRLDVAFGGAAVLGGAALAGRVASLVLAPPAALPAALVVLGFGALVWRVGRRLARPPAGQAGGTGGAVWPLLPWLAAWPLLALDATDPLVRAQLASTGTTICLYLAGWASAGLAGLWLWRVARSGETDAPCTGVPRGRRPQTGLIVVAALAFAATTYLNGAVLDPLQFRGFPDYVTQMGGARRLLDGALPYDPTARVWTDVNLPPITLLLLFAPFTALPELAGKLAYFTFNHVAFGAGLALLLLHRRAETAEPILSPGAVALVTLALAFEPWHDALRLGQQNGIVFFFLALAAVSTARRWNVVAGAALAVALIGKPSSALLGLYFLFAGRWKALAAAAAVGGFAFVVTLPWTGIENWRFYLLEKAPQIAAGTPQQSNVALLGFHARLLLPLDALASFDAMPPVPLAQALTRTSQVLGAVALWRLVRRRRFVDDALTRLLEFSFALVLSLALVGHAWQSYVTWLIVAFAALADTRVWRGVAPRARWAAGTLGVVCYAGLAVNDVWLHRVTGATSPAAALFAALPSLALLVYAYLLALLVVAYDRRHAPPARDHVATAAVGSGVSIDNTGARERAGGA